MRTDFGQSIFIFNKMAFIFLGVHIFYRFKFRVPASQIALTSSLMRSGHNAPNLNPLDYEVWGQCWSFNTSCNKSQKVSQFKNALYLIRSALPSKDIDNAVKAYRKRLQTCLLAMVDILNI